jgi:hypothetical protein
MVLHWQRLQVTGLARTARKTARTSRGISANLNWCAVFFILVDSFSWRFFQIHQYASPFHDASCKPNGSINRSTYEMQHERSLAPMTPVTMFGFWALGIPRGKKSRRRRSWIRSIMPQTVFREAKL